MLIIKIQNDGTGTPEIGNYRYQVMVNDTVIESGKITGFQRIRGWARLVEELILDCDYKEAIWLMNHPDEPEAE